MKFCQKFGSKRSIVLKIGPGEDYSPLNLWRRVQLIYYLVNGEKKLIFGGKFEKF